MLNAALLSALLVAATPEESCSEPPSFEWAVSALHDPVAEDSSRSLATIQEAARQRDTPAKHPPLGFYTGSFGHDLIVRTDKRTSPDGSRCSYVTSATIRLALVHRVIGVAHDLRDNPCAYDAALRHYRKHAAADDAALSLYGAFVRKELALIRPKVESMLGQSGGPDEMALRKLIEPVVNRAVSDEQVRTNAMAAVDSRSEVERLAADTACSRI